MKIYPALFLFLCSLAAVQADDKIASAQQALKDQGFYYGEITGQNDTDTTAAIRRFQIRSGLQITGELNEETLKALRSGSASATTPAPALTPAITRAPTPSRQPETNDLRDDSGRETDETEPPPQRLIVPPQDRQGPSVYPGAAVPSRGGNFADTPYANAPLQVQQEVIAKAQRKLARRDLYRGEITGVFGPDLEFSLRAYQSRVGLEATGRLDLQTLAALELLPGANQPVFTPRRGLRLPPPGEPPVRGEWVRP